VVNELHKVLVLPRGLFASGKFDQYKRDIPYTTLAQAFPDPGPVRSSPRAKAEVDQWRAALAEAGRPETASLSSASSPRSNSSSGKTAAPFPGPTAAG